MFVAADRTVGARYRGRWTALLLVLFFVLLPTAWAAGEECVAPLTQGDVQKVCDALGSGARADVGREAALWERQLAERSAAGQYRTRDRDQQCYRLAGSQVRIYAEAEQGVLADRFTTRGDTSDTSHVQVLSCQLGRRGQEEGDRFVEVSVQLFWSAADPDRLAVTAGRKRLAPGESTEVQARLQCGPCPVPGKGILFSAGPGGTLSPSAPVTDGQGIARTRFTLGREQPVTVSARHESLVATTVIEPRWLPWKVAVHGHFRGIGEGYRGAAEVRAEFSGVLLGKMIHQARALIRSGELAGYPLQFMQVHAPITTTATLQGEERHLVGDRWDKISFDRSSPATLFIGLAFHEGRPDRTHLYVDMDVQPILIFSGPAGQVFFRFMAGSCPPDKSVVKEAMIPLDRPPAAIPFTLESRLRTSGGCGEWRISYTFVPQVER